MVVLELGWVAAAMPLLGDGGGLVVFHRTFPLFLGDGLVIMTPDLVEINPLALSWIKELLVLPLVVTV